MRHVLLLLALSSFDLCATNPSQNSSTTTTSPASACDKHSACSDCTTCAMASTCADELAACQSDSSCQAIDQCYGVCGPDASCRADCDAANPTGVAGYQALMQCIDCTACPTACAGYGTCP